MRKKCLYRALAMMLSLCLLAGCSEPVTPPTLTPTLEKTQVIVKLSRVTADGSSVEDQTYLYDEGDAENVHRSGSVTDHKGDAVTFTLGERDPDTLSAVVSFDKPLLHGGTEVTSVTVTRDEKAVLVAYGEDGAKDVFTLTLDMNYSKDVSSLFLDFHSGMTMCYGDGILLTLCPQNLTDHDVFVMTFADKPALAVRGTYTLTDDTLTLYEDAGLSVTVLHRNKRQKAWQFDAEASARHTLALLPALTDGTLLTFGFSYDVNRDKEYIYDYRITDFDGQTLLSQKDLDSKVTITPLSPTMLCIKTSTYGKTPSTTRYLNTKTGECSASYSGVCASTATHTVYVKNDQLIIEELGGAYTRYTYDAATLGNFKDISNIMLEGDILTMLYRDKSRVFRAGMWNLKTGEPLPHSPLMITGATKRLSDDLYVLSEDGETFAPPARVEWEGRFDDRSSLYHSGVDGAALYFAEHWISLSQFDRLTSESIPIDDLDFFATSQTAAELEAILQEDAAAGLVTAETWPDGNVAVYHYNGMSRYHTVTFADTPDGRCVYIGDVEAALRHAAGDEETSELMIKFMN